MHLIGLCHIEQQAWQAHLIKRSVRTVQEQRISYDVGNDHTRLDAHVPQLTTLYSSCTTASKVHIRDSCDGQARPAAPPNHLRLPDLKPSPDVDTNRLLRHVRGDRCDALGSDLP